MAANWRTLVQPPSVEEIDRYLSGDKNNEDHRIGARYIPNVETTKLPEDQYPGGVYYLRVLPSLSTSPHKFCFITYTLFLRDFGIGVDDEFCIHPDILDKNPISKFRFELYRLGTEPAKEFAGKIWHKARGHVNVIARKLPLINEQGKRENFENVGPRVLRVPSKSIEVIYQSFKDPEIGDFTDLDNGSDMKWKMERREVPVKGGGNKKLPQYDISFARRTSKAHESDDKIGQWMENLPDLSTEYKPVKEGFLEEVAEKLREKWGEAVRVTVQAPGAAPTQTKTEDLVPASTPAPLKPADQPIQPQKAKVTDDETPRATPRTVPTEPAAPPAQPAPAPQSTRPNVAPSQPVPVAQSGVDDDDDLLEQKLAKLNAARSAPQ